MPRSTTQGICLEKETDYRTTILHINMRRIILIATILIGTYASILAAVPKKVLNTGKAVATVVTYGADGKMISTSPAFILGEKGEAVSVYSAFNNARSAEFISPSGSKLKVSRISGASDIYDVIKFSLEQQSKESVSLAKEALAEGSAAYILRRSASNKPEAVETKVNVKKSVSGGTYYELAAVYDEKNVGCPVVNANGECVAMVQRNSGKDKTTYAVGADFCNALEVSERAYASASLNSVNIAKALPEGEDKAYTYIYMLSQVKHDKDMLNTAIEDFIAKYPQNSDGYVERAKMRAAAGEFKQCEEDIDKAVSLAEKKDNPHYVLSRLVYQNALYNSEKATAAGWTLEKAVAEAQAAYGANPLPLYQLQMGDCYFGLKNYPEAVNMYSAVNASQISTPETFFYEAKARARIDSLDDKILVALDSAIARFAKPYSKAAAPYIFERANQYNIAGKYRESTLDYLEYEHIIGFQNLNDNFYYIREQIALKGKLYKQADDDINRALAIKPNDYVYNAEKSALMLRLGQFDEAIMSAQRAIKIDANAADGYRLLGIAYGETKKKQLCIQNLQKAKQLGDAHADELLKQYK